MTPALEVHCSRLHALLTRPACALRYHTACQRWAPIYAQACLGCDVGAGNVAFLPVAALTRRRRPTDAYRCYEATRQPQQRAPILPDPRPRNA